MFLDNNFIFNIHIPFGKFLIFHCFLIILYSLSYAAVKPRLYEGDSCNMGNRNGICTRESQCKTLKQEIINNLVNARDIVCGFLATETVVCCKEIITVNSHSTPIDIGKRPAKLACDNIQRGLHLLLGEHVLNGFKVDYGEMPFVVALGYTDEGSDRIDYRCGGTLIHPRFVLTAAHCVQLGRSVLTTIRLGINNITDQNEINDGLFINVKNKYVHCNYSLGYHDIAVLEMERDAYTGSGLRNIRATCLNFDRNSPSPGSEVTVAGWGWINESTRQSSNILLKGKVYTVDLRICNESYYNVNEDEKDPGFGPFFESYGLINTHLCAHDENKKNPVDTCSGDSGGPLIQILDPARGDYRVAGVTSQGYGCGGTIPPLYTRVSEYIDFIEDIVWNKKPYSSNNFI